jgi:hypothetical protein
MVASMKITKVTARARVVVDLDVWMGDADQHDFQPRATLTGTTLSLRNADDDEEQTSIDLEDDVLIVAERDRSIELRIKFGVHGMHETLIHKTPNPRIGPKAKKLAQARWKTLLPLNLRSA